MQISARAMLGGGWDGRGCSLRTGANRARIGKSTGSNLAAASPPPARASASRFFAAERTRRPAEEGAFYFRPRRGELSARFPCEKVPAAIVAECARVWRGDCAFDGSEYFLTRDRKLCGEDKERVSESVLAAEKDKTYPNNLR